MSASYISSVTHARIARIRKDVGFAQESLVAQAHGYYRHSAGDVSMCHIAVPAQFTSWPIFTFLNLKSCYKVRNGVAMTNTDIKELKTTILITGSASFGNN